jgi:hydroxyacylglutathione hydrolase
MLFSYAKAQEFKVVSQVSGPGETNSYLIYCVASKEAAIIDPGGPVDTLITCIKVNDLNVKYILITHAHVDHIFGVPQLKNMFPKAKLCMNQVEYKDIFTALKWVTDNYGIKWIESVRSNPETSKLLDFDMNEIGVPDIFVNDDQTFKLGLLEIKTILTPGHSPGGICYFTENILFSGDVLFYRSVGRTDTQNGSKEALIKSVKKLYEIFPDSTVVYPGHGQFTDISSEKKENRRIPSDKENMK